MSPDSGYLKRFGEMIDNIKNDKDRVLLTYKKFPPILPDVLAKIEAEIGIALDPSMTSFFKQTNGLQLRWTLRSPLDDSPDNAPNEAFDWMLPWKHQINDTSVVNIIPLEMAILGDWKGYTWFGEESWEVEFLGRRYAYMGFIRMIKPFDLFSGYYNMVFFLNENSSPSVLLSEDNLAGYTGSKLTDFTSYIEFLLATEGVVTQRAAFYGDEWDNLKSLKDPISTPREYWEQGRQAR